MGSNRNFVWQAGTLKTKKKLDERNSYDWKSPLNMFLVKLSLQRGISYFENNKKKLKIAVDVPDLNWRCFVLSMNCLESPTFPPPSDFLIECTVQISNLCLKKNPQNTH